MRESEIRLFQAQAAQRSALVFKQFQFIDARLRAIESVVYSLSFWMRAWYFLFPGDLKRVVDSVHLSLLRDMEYEYEEAVKKAKEEASKPKIQVVSGMNGHV